VEGLKLIVQSEPAVIIGLVNAVLALIVLFGVPLSEEQSAGIIVFVNVVLGFATRMMVTPVAKVDARVDAEVEKALTEDAEPMTDEQRQLITDLRAIITTLQTAERGR
jgi:hypothetical protein